MNKKGFPKFASGRLLIGFLVLFAFAAYALISNAWRGFEKYGFQIVIAFVVAVLHHVYWLSNRNNRATWSPMKRRVVYTSGLLALELVALVIELYSTASGTA